MDGIAGRLRLALGPLRQATTNRARCSTAGKLAARKRVTIMKTRILKLLSCHLFLVAMAILFVLQAQSKGATYTNLVLVIGGTNSVSLTIKSNQVAKVITAQLLVFGSHGLYVTVGGEVFVWGAEALVSATSTIGFGTVGTVAPPTIAGPAVIELRDNNSGYNHAYVLVEITNTDESFVPSNAVVVPADAGGPVNIILESSADLTTWTPATPGTYGTSTQKRFFRVRAQRTP